MISYEDAVAKILDNVRALTPEQKPLSKCIGQVTAENIYSGMNLPQVDGCGPDGSSEVPEQGSNTVLKRTG